MYYKLFSDNNIPIGSYFHNQNSFGRKYPKLKVGRIVEDYGRPIPSVALHVRETVVFLPSTHCIPSTVKMCVIRCLDFVNNTVTNRITFFNFPSWLQRLLSF